MVPRISGISTWNYEGTGFQQMNDSGNRKVMRACDHAKSSGQWNVKQRAGGSGVAVLAAPATATFAAFNLALLLAYWRLPRFAAFNLAFRLAMLATATIPGI